MSVKQEARVLTLLLKNLARQGSSLLANNPSMEQATHFAQLTNAYLLPTGASKFNLSIESTASPESIVDVSLESIWSTIKGLLGVTEKAEKAKVGMGEGKGLQDYKAALELKAKNSKAIQDKSWVTAAEMNTGVVTIPGNHQHMFQRKMVPLQSATEVMKEFAKDLSAYRKSFGELAKQARPYLKWTQDSWDKCEKAYRDYEHSIGGKFAQHSDPELTERVEAIVNACLAKRPPVPTEAARSLPEGLLGSEEKPVPLELVAATKDELSKLIELWDDILDFNIDAIEIEYELWDSGCGGDFTDPPWRNNAMQAAIWTTKNDFSKWTGYEEMGEYALDHIEDFVYNLEQLEDALYHYILASIKTKP